MDENTEGESLSSEEKAYFDSRGESEVKAEPETKAEPEAEPETEVVDEVESDVETEPKAEGEEPKPQKTVPLAALTKERAERKAEKARLADLERQNSIWQDRWNQILAANEPAKVEDKADAPPTDDPIAALNWLVERTTKQDAASKEAAEQTRQREEQERTWNTAYTKITTDFAEAVKSDPSLDDAYKALWGSKYREMEALGYEKDQINAVLAREEAQHIIHMAQSGKSVADYIKGLAGARGWAPKAAEPKADAAADIKKLAEAVDGSTTLSGAGGEGPRVMDARAIADMSPTEFEAWLGKPGNMQKFRRAAGG